MNVISPFTAASSTRATTRSQDGPPLLQAETPAAQAVDTFYASPVPTAVAPSSADVAAAAEPSSPSRSALQQGTLVGVMVAASLLGGCAGAAQALPTLPEAPAQSEVYVSGRQASEAVDSFAYLQKVGVRDGGGNYRSYLGGLVRQDLTPLQAFENVANGNSVQYVDKAQATPHEIRTFEDLRDLRSRVEENEARRTIDEGLEQIRDGFRAIGDAIRNN